MTLLFREINGTGDYLLNVESFRAAFASLAASGMTIEEAARALSFNLEELARRLEEVRAAAREVLHWLRRVWWEERAWIDPLPAAPFVLVRAVCRLGRDISGAKWRRLRG